MLPYDWPDIGAEDNQGEFSAAQLLLVTDVLIRGNHHVESGLFRHPKKLAVVQLVGPLHFDEGADLVFAEEATHTDRDIFVKQDAQCGDS